jgi:type I restriction enzyme R subunit
VSDIDKKALSERDICSKLVTPALTQVGWDLLSQIREQFTITKGRVQIEGSYYARESPKFADYVLFYRPYIPLAIIEAKDNNHSVGSGMQQALGYAEMMDIPFIYSTNGDAFLEHDKTGTSERIEKELGLQEFPSPQALWRRYCVWRGIDLTNEHVIVQNYYIDEIGKAPRYFQMTAVNRVLDAIAHGQQRLLLVMATGTGKTFTAFQIVWRLWKAGIKKRILFLVDRNLIVDQAFTNDFKPFGSAMTKIKKRQIDKSYEIYLSLYQAISSPEEERNIYKQFSPDFFDLVVVDECHRGSAAEDAMWRDILDYFKSATHIGLTATPKETRYISTTSYFGDPIYTYSLKQGIEDGFLAPFRVIRVDIDKDLEGWRPTAEEIDKYGKKIPDRKYTQKDFDRELVLEKRTELVANRVTEFLSSTDPYDKTIVFCEDIDHAERMRSALVNENPELVQENGRYVVRITGDSPEGKAEIGNFIMPESRYPVIATTSRLLGTGLDATTCKLIVIDKNIGSMTEFKQIIGRGTRINEEFDKYFFTIMDFRKATESFADPEFDGRFEIDSEFPGERKIKKPVEEGDGRTKYYVGNVPVFVVAERVQYYDGDGKLITDSLKDYTKKAVEKQYASLDSFLNSWTNAEKKTAIIKELKEQGVIFEALSEEVGRDYDPFDLICHIAFDQPPRSRKERAEKARKTSYFAKFGDQARAVLDALLSKYADEGIENLENPEVLKISPFSSMGTPIEIVKNAFGGRANYFAAIKGLENCLYTAKC